MARSAWRPDLCEPACVNQNRAHTSTRTRPMTQPTPEDASWPTLHRVRRAIVVVDVVESVRLMQANEADTIDRWRRFVREVRQNVLPQYGGRMVKSLGDGMLLEFGVGLAAVRAALAIQEALAPYNTNRAASELIELRVGGHVAEVVFDEDDMYGAGVNLAARVATLGTGSHVVVTAALRDELGPGFDLEIRDLGECYFKHVLAPVRSFRIGGTAADAFSGPLTKQSELRPTIAVLPLKVETSAHEVLVIAELFVHDLIGQLSQSGHWNVISQLSSQAMSGRSWTGAEIESLIGANYAISGCCRESANGSTSIELTLANVSSGESLWTRRLVISADQLVQPDNDVTAEIAAAAGKSILGLEIGRASVRRLPTLEAHAILFQAISLMHRTSGDAVARAYQALEYLIDRHPRAPEARAWMAKCHVLRVANGQGADPKEESARARDHVRRALDTAPDHALALAMDGHVQMYIDRNLDGAEASYIAALEANPNESLAWLFRSSVHSHRAEGGAALACVERAARLSPLDPLDHYFNGFTAWACIAAGDYDRAEHHALRAMRSNCTHRPTYLTLTQAQSLLGKSAQARETAQQLQALIPDFTVTRYLTNFPGGESPFALMLAQSLRDVGIPA